MFKFKRYFLLIIYVLLAQHINVFAVPQLDVAVCYINESSNNCVFRPPSVLKNATNINSIQLTFNDLDFAISNLSTVNQENWGIQFTAYQSPGTSFFCTQVDCGGSGQNVQVDANNKDVKVVANPDPNDKRNLVKGTLVLTLSNFQSGTLPIQLQNLITGAISGNNLTLNVLYLQDGAQPPIDPSKAVGTSNAYFWGSDEGTLLNPPQTSALARFNGFVINIAPPTDLHSVKQNETHENLTDARDGHVTGYLIALWLSRDANGQANTVPCTTGGWKFDANTISYYLQAGQVPPTLTCTYGPPPYPYYDESTDGIGGISDNLGCVKNATLAPIAPYLDPASIVTDTSVDIPAFLPLTKQDWLKVLMANPGQEQPLNACYTLVYVPVSHTSWGKLGIGKNEVYGYTAWALNAGYSEDDPTPRLSLAHSNVGYMTDTGADIASIAKDPSLKLTTADCFIATAASNDVNSKSVFYWRILRDEYLTPMGITPYYYKYAPKFAHWLNEHPQYKPPINFVLEKTGGFFYYTALYTKNFINVVSNAMANIFVQKAEAFEDLNEFDLKDSSIVFPDEVQTEDQISQTEPETEIAQTEPETDIAQHEPEANIEVAQTPSAPEESNEYAANTILKPRYDEEYDNFERNVNFDFSFTGGVLFPTTDKNLYKTYYKHLTYDYELASNAIFRFSDFGWSIGGKLTYGYNSQKFTEVILTKGTQSNIRNLYLGGIELISGLRYRNVHFLFLQPSVFAGAGILRLREEAKGEQDIGTNGAGNQNQIYGVTRISAMFDLGANLDISLASIFMYSERELALEHDILLRLTAIYRMNPSKALSASGFILNVGFAFLL